MHLLSKIRSGILRKSPSNSSSQTTSGSFWLRECAQSIVEVALFVPVFTLLVCYSVDFGYFYLVAASLSSSARNATEYSVQGFSSVSGTKPPVGGPTGTATSVAALALADMSSFANASTAVSVYVCNPTCVSYNSAPAATPHTDPESTLFTLNRVDVYYTISPPIPLGGLIPAAIVPSVFHRSTNAPPTPNIRPSFAAPRPLTPRAPPRRGPVHGRDRTRPHPHLLARLPAL